MRTNGTEFGTVLQGFSLVVMLFYTIYLGFFSNRLRAYKLIKNGYMVKDAENPAIQRQLLIWKIGDSVVNNYKENQPHQSITPTSNLDELEKLGKLRDSGVLTEDEFTMKKKELLGL